MTAHELETWRENRGKLPGNSERDEDYTNAPGELEPEARDE